MHLQFQCSNIFFCHILIFRAWLCGARLSWLTKGRLRAKDSHLFHAELLGDISSTENENKFNMFLNHRIATGILFHIMTQIVVVVLSLVVDWMETDLNASLQSIARKVWGLSKWSASTEKNLSDHRKIRFDSNLHTHKSEWINNNHF